MKVIFLDIDGVLNNRGSAEALGATSKFLDPVSVGLVARICKDCDAKIVISSSWRSGNMDRLIDHLSSVGGLPIVKYIIGETPDFDYTEVPDPCFHRGYEIVKWIESSAINLKSYVIIDDCDGMYSYQPFIKTDFTDGFRYKEYLAARKLLMAL